MLALKQVDSNQDSADRDLARAVRRSPIPPQENRWEFLQQPHITGIWSCDTDERAQLNVPQRVTPNLKQELGSVDVRSKLRSPIRAYCKAARWPTQESVEPCAVQPYDLNFPTSAPVGIEVPSAVRLSAKTKHNAAHQVLDVPYRRSKSEVSHSVHARSKSTEGIHLVPNLRKTIDDKDIRESEEHSANP
ncbi:hypothetical protein NMY22_g1353 [Coprinellus aureogranulatus]|nr:hypothetical protein NMY22_g1353 [Coprinellus aureogranulatus]